MKEILVVVFLLTYRRCLILMNMIFFYKSLNIMVCVVLLMNGLNLMSQIENNMSQLMVLILILLMSNLVFLNGQFLVLCCFKSLLMI